MRATAGKRRHVLRASVVLGGVAAVLALTMPVLPASEAQEVTVTIRGLAYSPSTLEIQTGTTVVWHNKEIAPTYPVVGAEHQVRADDGSFESPVLGWEQSFALPFLNPGTFSYACVLHPQLMTGEVRVSGEPVKPVETEKSVAITDSGETSSWGFDPDDVTIPEGGTIKWRNTGSATHTVTASDGSFDSGNIAPGGTFEIEFSKATSVSYFCKPHTWMNGVVRVAAPGQDPPPPPPPVVKRGNRPPPPRVEPVRRSANGPATFTVHAVEPSPTDIMRWGFDPSGLRVRVGDTVVWRNTGASPHTVTAADGSFDSGMLDAGETFELTFDKTGAVAYACTPHPWMKASLTIVPAGAAGGGPVPDAPAPDQDVTDPDTGTPTAHDAGGGAGGGHEPVGQSGSTRLALGTAAMMLLFGAALLLAGRWPGPRRGTAGADAAVEAVQARELQPV